MVSLVKMDNIFSNAEINHALALESLTSLEHKKKLFDTLETSRSKYVNSSLTIRDTEIALEEYIFYRLYNSLIMPHIYGIDTIKLLECIYAHIKEREVPYLKYCYDWFLRELIGFKLQTFSICGQTYKGNEYIKATGLLSNYNTMQVETKEDLDNDNWKQTLLKILPNNFETSNLVKLKDNSLDVVLYENNINMLVIKNLERQFTINNKKALKVKSLIHTVGIILKNTDLLILDDRNVWED